MRQLDGEQRDLFPTGKQPEPLVCALNGDKFALGRDEQTILVDIDGNPCTKYTLTWSERPSLIGIFLIKNKLIIRNKLIDSTFVHSGGLSLHPRGIVFLHRGASCRATATGSAA